MTRSAVAVDSPRVASLLIGVMLLVVLRAASVADDRASMPPAGQPVNGRTLWVLAVGVSQYAEPGLRLGFAASDARAIAAALGREENGPLYGAVKTKVLADAEVTRASILQTLESFLGQASPLDVGVIYLAGHGMRDAATKSYYFLPATATGANLIIEGLDMVEFDRQVTRLHSNIGSLVVILDTCYAGTMAEGTRDIRLGEDLASSLASAEGLYILAAAKSGEQSRETAALGHGAFTKALLDGLQGAAADPGDRLIRILGLASYAERVVPQLTEGKQHPYYRITGGNPVIAAHPGERARVTPPAISSLGARGTPSSARRERIAVVDFKNLPGDSASSWMGEALGEEFTTTLNMVTHLDVYSDREMRFIARGTTNTIEAARQAEMTKIVSGAYAVHKGTISITAHVQDVTTLRNLASAKKEGPLNKFFALRSEIAKALLDQLRVELSDSEASRILKPGTTDWKARQLLHDAESSGTAEPALQKPAGDSGRRSMTLAPFLAAMSFARTSFAAEPEDLDAELRTTLEGYRRAYERKDLDALSRYYLEFSDKQRAALTRYLQNANELQVVFDSVRITLSGDRAAVSFTREDRFVDRDTGETQQIVVRLTKVLAKGPEGWRIVPAP